MLIKVCGLNDVANYTALAELESAPDYFGTILYPESPRHANSEFIEAIQALVPAHQKVLVVVDATIDTILDYCFQNSFGIVQLHGPDYTKEEAIRLIDAGIEVWKVFPMKHDVPKEVNNWHGFADVFLFDTKTDKHGGSGEHFDWAILSAYKGPTAFMLSGGIAIEDVERLSHYKHEFCVGFDLNSKFETEAGIKDVQLVQQFAAIIRTK